MSTRHVVTIYYKPEPSDLYPLPVVHIFQTASRAIEFKDRQKNKVLVERVEYKEETI